MVLAGLDAWWRALRCRGRISSWSAINDLVPADNLAYLFKYDTVHGRYPKAVKAEEKAIIVDGMKFEVFSEKDPALLPWKKLNVDYVD